jgi:hypothetical protein|tara:strand:+ start:1330 stop:1788 length:459 start_codon:yes stop_codon:yes gene_type:complete
MMACITQADMDKVDYQLMQYQLAINPVDAQYQAEYDKRIPYQRYAGDTGNEKKILARLMPMLVQLNEAKAQKAKLSKLEICEDIEKKKAKQAQFVASERIKELEEQLKLIQPKTVSSDPIIVSSTPTAPISSPSLSLFPFIIIGIILIGVLA